MFRSAAEGSADGVIDTMDSFGWHDSYLMSQGHAKGEIVDQLLESTVLSMPPLNNGGYAFMEFGGYLEYSALRLGRLLRRVQASGRSGHVFSIEKDCMYAAMATKIIKFSGLSGVVTVVVGAVDTVLPKLATNS